MCFDPPALSLQLLSDKPHARHYRSVNESWHGQTKSCAYFKILALLNSSCQLGGDLISKWNIRQRWRTGGLGRVLPVCVPLLICVRGWQEVGHVQFFEWWPKMYFLYLLPPPPSLWVLVPWMLQLFNGTLNESSDRSEEKGNCSWKSFFLNGERSGLCHVCQTNSPGLPNDMALCHKIEV